MQISKDIYSKGDQIYIAKDDFSYSKAMRKDYISKLVYALLFWATSESQDIIFPGDIVAFGWPRASFKFSWTFSSSTMICYSSSAAELRGRMGKTLQ